MPSKYTTVSGKRPRTLGQGIPQAFPIQLDPAPFEGAIIYADDGSLKYSDGTAWLDIGAGFQGVQGTQGIQGDQGTQGEYGPWFHNYWFRTRCRCRWRSSSNSQCSISISSCW